MKDATAQQAETNARTVAMLHEFLAERDFDCPGCGYNLRSLQGQRCPECGSDLQLQVGLKQAAPITGLILLAAGAGMNGLLLIYLLLSRGFSRSGWQWRFFLVNGIPFVVLGTAMLIWLWRWRWIRRAPAGSRWALVAVCAMLAAADIIVFTKVIR